MGKLFIEILILQKDSFRKNIPISTIKPSMNLLDALEEVEHFLRKARVILIRFVRLQKFRRKVLLYQADRLFLPAKIRLF